MNEDASPTAHGVSCIAVAAELAAALDCEQMMDSMMSFAQVCAM